MLTQKRLKEVLDYYLETGIFRWKVNKSSNIKAGNVAGCFNSSNGYIQIKIDGKSYKAHRLAWLYVHGYFPENQVGHKDGIGNNNRIDNLRSVSQTCNLQNQKINSKNTSGFPGIDWNKQKQKWMARIKIQRKQYFIGLHETALDAALARYTVEVQCPQWHCNHRSELTKAIKQVWPEFKPV